MCKCEATALSVAGAQLPALGRLECGALRTSMAMKSVRRSAGEPET